MKKIYRFYANCGRMGSLDSLFIVDESEIEKIMGKDIYFGEILGKYSDVSIIIEPEHIEVVSEDQEFITKFIEIMGEGTISGHSPVEYYYVYLDRYEDESEEE